MNRDSLCSEAPNAWKESYGPLDHINVHLRGKSRPFEIFKHHGSNGIKKFFGFHVMLPDWPKKEGRQRT